MTLKRILPSNEDAVEHQQNKKRKIDGFFGELAVEGLASTNDQKFQSQNKKNKIKKKKKSKIPNNNRNPDWGKGGELLQNYIKVKELVDIESLIQKFLSENKIEIIDGIIAEKKAEVYNKNDEDNLKIKSSEIVRMERLKNSNKEATQCTDEQQNLDDYFKDALKIDVIKSFDSMDLHKNLLRAVNGLGYSTPTPIQAATVSVAMAGKDVCGCAATGTGKTAAYALPTLDRLLQADLKNIPVIRVLVVVPTRELGVQVFQVFQSLMKYTKLKIGLVAGGLSSKMQEKELLKKPHIVIATPGRLLTYIKNLEGFTLEHVEVLILDEADRILDDYFEEQMADIINSCSPHRQTLLFSATMTTEVKRVATAALTEPVKVFINSNTNVAQGLRQEYVLMKDGTQETRNATLIFLLIHVFSNNTLVFLPTKILCHRLYVVLRLCGLKVSELHSKMPQSARLHNLTQFAKGEVRVLLATDLAARGLDIKGVDNVINYKLSSSYEMYVHRVGRTARAGKQGLAVSMVPDKEYKALKHIKKMSKTIMYERRIDRKQVDEWKLKITKLNEVCDSILDIERKTLKRKEEREMKSHVDHLVTKNEKKIERQQIFAEKAKQRSQLKENAKSEGMTVKEYLREKRLQSMSVSNSKKKRVLRFKERQMNPLFKFNKKGLSNLETVPEIKQIPFVKRKVPK